jgi:hypothetical protein
MIALILFVLGILASPFKAKSRLEAENAALRQQLIVLRRKVKSRPRLANTDRWFFVQLYRWFPSILDVLTIIRPETLVRWHRAGFRRYWHWKSRRRGGRPQVQSELRALIRQMSVENPLWGAPRIHGELLKLGIDIGESSVSKYLVRCRKPPSQTWRTFLENHVKQMVSIDFFTVPIIRFHVLYVFLVLAHDRRRVLHFNVTAHPTAEWTGQQLREAVPYVHAAIALAKSLCGACDWLHSA